MSEHTLKYYVYTARRLYTLGILGNKAELYTLDQRLETQHVLMSEKYTQMCQDAVSKEKILKNNADPMYRHIKSEKTRIARAASERKRQLRRSTTVHKEGERAIKFLRKRVAFQLTKL